MGPMALDKACEKRFRPDEPTLPTKSKLLGRLATGGLRQRTLINLRHLNHSTSGNKSTNERLRKKIS